MTYSLARIFDLKGDQKSTLSKYKAVFGKFDEKDWSEELEAAETEDVSADILAAHIRSNGGVEGLSKPDTKEKYEKSLDKGKEIFSDKPVLGTVLAAIKKLELDPKKKETEYLNVLCRVNGDDLEILELGGYVKNQTLLNEGHARLVEEERVIEADVLFWKNVCVAYAALKAKNPVVSLQNDGKTIWISNASESDGSATANYTSETHR